MFTPVHDGGPGCARMVNAYTAVHLPTNPSTDAFDANVLFVPDINSRTRVINYSGVPPERARY